MPTGAATTDVIVQYVSTIKALREVDASGVLLEAIADPIREYVRSRKVMLSSHGGAPGIPPICASADDALADIQCTMAVVL